MGDYTTVIQHFHVENMSKPSSPAKHLIEDVVDSPSKKSRVEETQQTEDYPSQEDLNDKLMREHGITCFQCMEHFTQNGQPGFEGHTLDQGCRMVDEVTMNALDEPVDRTTTANAAASSMTTEINPEDSQTPEGCTPQMSQANTAESADEIPETTEEYEIGTQIPVEEAK